MIDLRRILLAMSLLLVAAAAGAAPPAGQAPGLRFLALGDSYTIGEGVAPADRWPVQLAGRLRQGAIGEPQIIARTGWTVSELSTGIDGASPKGPFDLVTLLIGVNDQYRGGDPEAYRPKFVALLKRAVEFAGGTAGRVVVLSIPDWSVTPFARDSGRDPARIAAAIERFNAVDREETSRAGVRFVDITPVSRRAGSEASLRAPDGLHYSGAMYGEWAGLALPAAAEALRVTRKP